MSLLAEYRTFQVLQVRTTSFPNRAHADISFRLYKTVYPNGLDAYPTPATSASGSRAPSMRSDASSMLSVATTTAVPASMPATPTSITPKRSGFFSRFTASASASPAVSRSSSLNVSETSFSSQTPVVEGSVDELILSGTAFGACHRRITLCPLTRPCSFRIRVSHLCEQHER